MFNRIIPFNQRETIMSKVGELIKEALMEAIQENLNEVKSTSTKSLKGIINSFIKHGHILDKQKTDEDKDYVHMTSPKGKSVKIGKDFSVRNMQDSFGRTIKKVNIHSVHFNGEHYGDIDDLKSSEVASRLSKY